MTFQTVLKTEEGGMIQVEESAVTMVFLRSAPSKSLRALSNV